MLKSLLAFTVTKTNAFRSSSPLFLPTSAMAGEQAERWRYAFRRRGTSLATTDTLGAATAVEHRATVVARIVRHYPMPEVPRLELPKPQR